MTFHVPKLPFNLIYMYGLNVWMSSAQSLRQAYVICLSADSIRYGGKTAPFRITRGSGNFLS